MSYPSHSSPSSFPGTAALPSCRTARNGFTLIEMTLAVGLGMLLVYTAVAGFRVASQAVTLSNRLSLENSLIRAGFNEAHQQLDFWTNLDNPDDPLRQRLRGKITRGNAGVGAKLNDMGMSNTVGLPFTPFSGPNGCFPPNQPLRTRMPTTDSRVPRYTDPLGIPQAPVLPIDGTTTPAATQWLTEADSDIGFDPTYVWAPHDPRTWYRGNCIEKNRGDRTGNTDPERFLPVLWFGRYGIFANTDQGSTLSFRTLSNLKPAWDDATSPYSASYASTSQPPARWYARQLTGLSRALGFYGMCDYLPSNTIYTTYLPYVAGRTSTGGMPKYFLPNQGFFMGQGMTNIPGLGLYSLTVTQSYGITNPTNRTLSDNELVDEHYRYYDSDYSTYWDTNNAAKLQNFMRITLGLDRLMDHKPTHWPEVSVGVARYIKSAKFANVARVRWVSPLTGQEAELSFTGVGTTLRGARMQRRPTGGWARWDNDPSTANNNDTHLDSP